MRRTGYPGQRDGYCYEYFPVIPGEGAGAGDSGEGIACLALLASRSALNVDAIDACPEAGCHQAVARLRDMQGKLNPIEVKVKAAAAAIGIEL